jgi:hypothetical protein
LLIRRGVVEKLQGAFITGEKKMSSKNRGNRMLGGSRALVGGGIRDIF